MEWEKRIITIKVMQASKSKETMEDIVELESVEIGKENQIMAYLAYVRL